MVGPLLVATLATSCGPPPPPELHRFLGVRLGERRNDLEIAFGRCGDEVVTEVTLRYADPPDELGEGVLWRIRSDGARVERFTVGATPRYFILETPLREPIPNQFVVIEVATDSRRWPITRTSFRLDQLGRTRYQGSLSDEPVPAADVPVMVKRGCTPRAGAYA